MSVKVASVQNPTGQNGQIIVHESKKALVPDIILHIFLKLNVNELFTAAKVCKNWKKIAYALIWKDLKFIGSDQNSLNEQSIQAYEVTLIKSEEELLRRLKLFLEKIKFETSGIFRYVLPPETIPGTKKMESETIHPLTRQREICVSIICKEHYFDGTKYLPYDKKNFDVRETLFAAHSVKIQENKLNNQSLFRKYVLDNMWFVESENTINGCFIQSRSIGLDLVAQITVPQEMKNSSLVKTIASQTFEKIHQLDFKDFIYQCIRIHTVVAVCFGFFYMTTR